MCHWSDTMWLAARQRRDSDGLPPGPVPPLEGLVHRQEVRDMYTCRAHLGDQALLLQKVRLPAHRPLRLREAPAFARKVIADALKNVLELQRLHARPEGIELFRGARQEYGRNHGPTAAACRRRPACAVCSYTHRSRC